jgi:hypothetical protein
VMLRMVLEDAVQEFDLPKNPSRRVRRLPVRRPTDEEPNLLTGAELGRVLTWLAAKEPDHHPLAATLALTGLRRRGDRAQVGRSGRGCRDHSCPAGAVAWGGFDDEDRDQPNGAAGG